MKTRSTSRRARLRLEMLEGRLAPASTILANTSTILANNDFYSVNENLAGQQPAEFNFATDNGGWTLYGSSTITPSADGLSAIFTGDASNGRGPYTLFDGMQYAFPQGGFKTEIQIYLDPSWSVGEGFDYSVALSRQNGDHLRDFVFHVAKQSTGDLLVGADNSSNNHPRMDLATGDHY